MLIKNITETKQVQKTIYVAYDGAQFEKMDECIAYESAPCRIVADIPHAILGQESVYPNCTESDAFVIFVPRDHTDISNISQYAKVHHVDIDVCRVDVGDPMIFTATCYGTKIDDVEDLWSYIGSADDFRWQLEESVSDMMHWAMEIIGNGSKDKN